MNAKENTEFTLEEQLLINEINSLLNIIMLDTLNADEVANRVNMISKTKEKLVRERYFKDKKRKTFYNLSDGRVKSYNPQFIANTETELIKKLYDYYFITKKTFKDLFEDWVRHRNDIKNVKPKTIEEDLGVWRRNLNDSVIAEMPIDSIKPLDLFHIYEKWTGNGLITEKEFSNRTRVINGVFKYGVKEGFCTSNPNRDLPTDELKFKSPEKKDKVYTEDERKTLLEYIESLEQDPYSLAIQLCFHSILRIGELKALKWNPENPNLLKIESQIVVERPLNDDLSLGTAQKVECDPKGNASFSIRNENIDLKGVEILYQMKELNPDGKYLFMYDGKILSTDTFNRRLKKYCNAIDIPYRSSHKIRFTTASICYENGMVETDLQYLLGHSNLTMTQHYLRSVTKNQGVQQMAQYLA